MIISLDGIAILKPGLPRHPDTSKDLREAERLINCKYADVLGTRFNEISITSFVPHIDGLGPSVLSLSTKRRTAVLSAILDVGILYCHDSHARIQHFVDAAEAAIACLLDTDKSPDSTR